MSDYNWKDRHGASIMLFTILYAQEIRWPLPLSCHIIFTKIVGLITVRSVRVMVFNRVAVEYFALKIFYSKVRYSNSIPGGRARLSRGVMWRDVA